MQQVSYRLVAGRTHHPPDVLLGNAETENSVYLSVIIIMVVALWGWGM